MNTREGWDLFLLFWYIFYVYQCSRQRTAVRSTVSETEKPRLMVIHTPNQQSRGFYVSGSATSLLSTLGYVAILTVVPLLPDVNSCICHVIMTFTCGIAHINPITISFPDSLIINIFQIINHWTGLVEVQRPVNHRERNQNSEKIGCYRLNCAIQLVLSLGITGLKSLYFLTVSQGNNAVAFSEMCQT